MCALGHGLCPTEFNQKLCRGYEGLRAYEITSKITYTFFKHLTDLPRKFSLSKHEKSWP